MKVCQALLGQIKRETDFLRQVITGDETWIFEYDPETHSHDTLTTRQEGKTQQIQSKKPCLLISLIAMAL